MHYYKRNLGDYSKKAGRLSMLQHGAYTLLMDACYDREQFPTMEEAIDWTWASSKEEIEAVEFVLKKFFVLIDGVYVQTRIKEEIEEYQAKADTNKRIAREREEKRKAEAEVAKRALEETIRARTVDETCSEEDEPPPNQEPITNNQKPPSKDKGFRPPSVDEVSAYCAQRQNRIDPGTFVDFYTGKGWMVGKAKMKDWQACIRTWEKREENRNAKRKGTVAEKWAIDHDDTSWLTGPEGQSHCGASESDLPGASGSVHRLEEHRRG